MARQIDIFNHNLPYMEELDPFQVLSMQVGDIKASLDSMLTKNEITEDDYSKQIALLAYEFALNGYIDDCVLMLLNVKDGYFSKGGIIHFNADDEYFEKCVLIFEVLSHSGFVPYDIFATQKSATA